jgi:raffinose/stachyose/melibiose transport system permease protein
MPLALIRTEATVETSTYPRTSVFKKYLPRAVQYFVLSVAVILVLVPVVILIFTALKTRGEALTHPYDIPNPPRWENFATVLTSSVFWQLLGNSVIVMLATTTGVLSVCSLAAFVFARMKFRGRDLAFNLLLLGLMFPINVAILPVYLLVRQMDLTNTLLAIVLVQVAYATAGNIMILRGFFMTIPAELEDAAYIDGCSTFGFFWDILLPLARPALAAVGALTMIVSWNDLLVPLVLVDKEALWTLPFGTMQFQGQYGQDIALVAAFTMMSAVPAVIFYLFAERHIVSGLTAGAVKS